MGRQLLPAVRMVIVLTVVLGLGYPGAVWAVGRVAMSQRAQGSLVTVDGKVVGSSLIGQQFVAPRYFHPRPSAAGPDGYDAMASGASNLGPSNPAFRSLVAERARAYRVENGLAPGAGVPADAVTASASGLDPDISVANAMAQLARVASARGVPSSEVLIVVRRHEQGRTLGFLGERRVDVLALDLDLDRSLPAPTGP